MRALSAKSIQTDPYRAGLEIGMVLAAISPEVVLLFASISYDPDFSDFFEALYDGLGSSSVLVFGGTGDGIYQNGGAENYGVSALGITSDGTVVWSAALAEGVGADSYAAARKCALQARAGAAEADCFRMVLADGAKADGQAVVNGIASCISGPFFGGLTGDDRKFTRSKLFLNGREYEDAVAILSGRGQIRFAVNGASGWTPFGRQGVVEQIDGCRISTISGLSAQEFMARELGKPLGESDMGIVPLAAYQHGSTEHFCLRTPSRFHPESGALTTFGSVEAGTIVRACSASREEMLGGVQNALDGLAPESLGFSPAAAIIISCAGRKWLMGDSGEKELAALQASLGAAIPLAGFPSFGEISPFRRAGGGYTAVSFHNVTFVVCLIG